MFSQFDSSLWTPTIREKSEWKPSFQGCQTSISKAPEIKCSINKYPERYYIPDLNEMIYERSILSGQQLNPYEHMHARQLFTQYISKDVLSQSDPYSITISKPEDSCCISQKD